MKQCRPLTSDLIHRYASSGPTILETFNQANAFGKLMDAASKVSNQHAEMPVADVVAMFIGLVSFAGAVYPDRLDCVDAVLTSCYKVVALQ